MRKGERVKLNEDVTKQVMKYVEPQESEEV